MADNVPITAGSGTNIAADDVSSVFYQKIKIDAGGDGVSVPLVAGRQAVAAALPVGLSTEDLAALRGNSAGSANATALVTSGNVYNLFGGGAIVNGFSVYNAHATATLWISDNTATPAANATDSIGIPPGGEYSTPPGYQPVGTLYALAGATPHTVSARRW